MLLAIYYGIICLIVTGLWLNYGVGMPLMIYGIIYLIMAGLWLGVLFRNVVRDSIHGGLPLLISLLLLSLLWPLTTIAQMVLIADVVLRRLKKSDRVEDGKKEGDQDAA